MTKTQNTKKTLKIQTNLKAGGIQCNHVEVALKTLKVQTNLKAGGIAVNHVEIGLKAK